MHTSTWLVYKRRVKEEHDPLQKLNLMRFQLHTHLPETIVIPAREHLEMNFLWLQSLLVAESGSLNTIIGTRLSELHFLLTR